MGSKDWKYELVILFDDEEGTALDQVIAFEDELIELLDGVAEVDGHDTGSGTAHISILTNAPKKLWERLEPMVEEKEELGARAAAYREVDDDDFSVVWPSDFEEEEFTLD